MSRRRAYPAVSDQLFIVLDRLKSEGRAILYISHKLEEVEATCDTATILRGGRKVSTCNPQAENCGLARPNDGRRRYQEVKAAAAGRSRCRALLSADLSHGADDPHASDSRTFRSS